MSDLGAFLSKERIHFGSLEESLSLGGSVQAILEKFERDKIARNLAVPTEDRRVRARLREQGEPITLFGEGPAERRDRLRAIMARKIHERDPNAVLESESEEESEEDEEEKEEEFFSYGSEELLDARKWTADFSLVRAKSRVDAQKAELEIPFPQRKKIRHEWFSNTFETRSMQYGDERPIGSISFAPNSRLLATASFSGSIKLWSSPECTQLMSLKGHNARVSGLAFHPRSTLDQSPGALNLVSGATDGGVNLWSFEQDTPIASLIGHELRVARVAFHPSGRFIGTASFDKSWRLWDAETQKELLLQDGHSREVFAIGFQDDGALVATGGQDAIARIWDLRTGRSIWAAQGHVKQLLCLDWSPNGHELVTGSEDNTLRIFDLRATRCRYTIPAHTNLVTNVKFWHAGDSFERGVDPSWSFRGTGNGAASDAKSEAPGVDAMEVDTEAPVRDRDDHGAGGTMRRQLLDGSFLVSSSHDGSCKIWTDGDYKPIKALTGSEGTPGVRRVER
ncbi:WD40-repeat-containing domain protein [Blyttiomyces helicus]|uniref:WD40-repeat-containing domain protein n=1 Tax=Blyttiomyces helicus TaxID=388810 RepID=A0A4V1IQV5_9FUNG|nr:WD40-repeat-containing domain protein [Blyttiomyces helicus]|eukprot:RKO87877.1 WD40-repeat-containing domain protein [Blyttiomyces helicus]